MPTELITRPLLALPEGTTAGDAQRLAQALDIHGVAGVLRLLDAVTTLMQGLQQTTASARAPRQKSNPERCGQPNRAGNPCRRHLPCSWHRPDGGEAPFTGVETAEAPAEDPETELSPQPAAGEPQAIMRQKPSGCPKCDARASSICRERLPGGMSEWVCRTCGWRKPIENSAPAA